MHAMMHSACFLLLPLAACSDMRRSSLTAVSYGLSAPVQTLSPIRTQYNNGFLGHHAIEMPTSLAGLLTDSAFESASGPTSARLAKAADGQKVIARRQTNLDPASGANSEPEESSADEGADSDQDTSDPGSASEADSFDGDSEPWDDSSDEDFDPNTAGKPKPKGKPKGPAASPPASKQPSKGVNPNGVTKGKFAGTLQFDCLEAPEQCQNICWFQNCVNDPSTPIEYMKGNDKVSNFNRVQSGVTTQNGRPCMTGPFGQKFWDT